MKKKTILIVFLIELGLFTTLHYLITFTGAGKSYSGGGGPCQNGLFYDISSDIIVETEYGARVEWSLTLELDVQIWILSDPEYHDFISDYYNSGLTYARSQTTFLSERFIDVVGPVTESLTDTINVQGRFHYVVFDNDTSGADQQLDFSFGVIQTWPAEYHLINFLLIPVFLYTAGLFLISLAVMAVVSKIRKKKQTGKEKKTAQIMLDRTVTQENVKDILKFQNQSAQQIKIADLVRNLDLSIEDAKHYMGLINSDVKYKKEEIPRLQMEATKVLKTYATPNLYDLIINSGYEFETAKKIGAYLLNEGLIDKFPIGKSIEFEITGIPNVSFDDYTTLPTRPTTPSYSPSSTSQTQTASEKNYLYVLPMIGAILAIASVLTPAAQYIGLGTMYIWFWGFMSAGSLTGFVPGISLIICLISTALIALSGIIGIIKANKIRKNQAEYSQEKKLLEIAACLMILGDILWIVSLQIFYPTSSFFGTTITFWTLFTPGFGVIGAFIGAGMILASVPLEDKLRNIN